MSDTERAILDLSHRRSNDRVRVLLVLLKHRAMFPRELADACKMDAGRLKKVVEGYGDSYRRELSPMPLGLVVRVETSEGQLYVLTPKGIREAERLRGVAPDERGWRA